MPDDADRNDILKIMRGKSTLEARQLLELRRRVSEQGYRDAETVEVVARRLLRSGDL